MRPTTSALIGWALLPCFGCAYNDYYTFANTRKLLESTAPGITKVGFAPLIAAQETMVSPVTIYLDTAAYATDNDEIYLSYLGMQTVIASDMHGIYKALASLMIVPVDTAWFPVAGAVDTIRVINTRNGPRSRTATPPARSRAPREPADLGVSGTQDRDALGRGW